jgi:hypothetical protein
MSLKYVMYGRCVICKTCHSSMICGIKSVTSSFISLETNDAVHGHFTHTSSDVHIDLQLYYEISIICK